MRPSASCSQPPSSLDRVILTLLNEIFGLAPISRNLLACLCPERVRVPSNTRRVHRATSHVTAFCLLSAFLASARILLSTALRGYSSQIYDSGRPQSKALGFLSISRNVVHPRKAQTARRGRSFYRIFRSSRVRTPTSLPTAKSSNVSNRSTLFVSNLPYTATSTDLQTIFSDLAPVRSAFVVTEQGTGVSKGVGYVAFAAKEDATSAMEEIGRTGLAIQGRNLRVAWADKVRFFFLLAPSPTQID